MEKLWIVKCLFEGEGLIQEGNGISSYENVKVYLVKVNYGTIEVGKKLQFSEQVT